MVLDQNETRALAAPEFRRQVGAHGGTELGWARRLHRGRRASVVVDCRPISALGSTSATSLQTDRPLAGAGLPE